MIPEYQLKKSWTARSLRLQINKNGQLIVSAPALTPNFLIEKFVHDHLAWIEKRQTEILQKTPAQNGKIALFGQNYQLLFTYQKDLPSGFNLQQKQLLYNNSHYLLKPKNSLQLTKTEQEKLEHFLRQTIHQYLNQRTPILHQKMLINKPLGKVTIKDQSSRWGSCSSAGNLNFNYHLVHYEPAIIDYVIIHELAHLVHLNHSQAFWALVAKYDGQYQLHRRALKK